jgi:hypothetical protein
MADLQGLSAYLIAPRLHTTPTVDDRHDDHLQLLR